MEPEQKKVDEQFVKRVIGLFTVIAFITSVMYLYIYWHTFRINPFEFIDVSNIISYSIVPLLVGMVAMLCISFQYLAEQFTIPSNEHGEIAKYFERLVDKRWFGKKRLVIFLFMIVAILIAAQRFFYMWHVTTTFIALYLTGYLSIYLNLGKKLIPNTNIRFILYFVIVFLPLEGAAFGMYEAQAIKRGDKYLYLDGTSISEEVRELGDDKIRYIGTMGDYFFFLIPSDNSTYIAAKEEIKPFILKRYDRLKDKNLFNWFKKLLKREQ